MPKIAISYRRTDANATGRIYDRLVHRYGKESIFRDIDRIHFGVDFRKAVHDALNDTDVLLAIVGPNGRGVADDGRIRINEATELVRIEPAPAMPPGMYHHQVHLSREEVFTRRNCINRCWQVLGHGSKILMFCRLLSPECIDHSPWPRPRTFQSTHINAAFPSP